MTFHQLEKALLNGEILEDYPDTGRGESCLVLGFSDDIPIHAVCGWRGQKLSLITVYVPKPPKFIDPWTRGKTMEKKKCNFCGSTEYEQRRTDYLYSYKGNYLLVPNTPVEICQNCGMVYYDASVLKKIENHFFAIQRKHEAPDHYLEIPQWAYS